MLKYTLIQIIFTDPYCTLNYLVQSYRLAQGPKLHEAAFHAMLIQVD